MLTLHREERSADDLRRLLDVQAFILGPSNDRGPEKAVKVNGEWVGGVGFERSDRAVSIEKDKRCYQLATSFQVQKLLSAPAANTKVHEIKKDHDAKMRFEILKVGYTAHLKCPDLIVYQTGAETALPGLKKGPKNMLPALKRQADVAALPRVGSSENVAWPAMQLNLVSAVAFGACKLSNVLMRWC